MLDDLGADIILRCPMIPGYNITDAHVNGIIDVASKLKHLSEIHLEPYHNIGVSKRIGLGMREGTDMITPPDRDEMVIIAKKIRAESNVTTKVM